MHCVHTIKTELSEVEGITSVDASPEKKQVTVEFNAPASDKKIRDTLKEINYPAV
jgi:copper chaperone CopZ